VISKATGDLLSYLDANEVEGTLPPPSWNVAPPRMCLSWSRIRPATTSKGWVVGPMTAPQMISKVFLCFSFRGRAPGVYGWFVRLMRSPSMPVCGRSSSHCAATSGSVVVGERDSGGCQLLASLPAVGIPSHT
jgi:hypothetical protein